jgi:phosphoribosylamine---glycine ligase
MKVLLVGGGGREHAIAWKLLQSPRVSKLYCAPGNGGIADLAELVPIKATDLAALVRFAQSEQIDLVFVAPDDPLAMGLVDLLEIAGIRAFGPNKAAALLEASKSFSKDLMLRYGIPTAAYQTFRELEAALAYIAEATPPIVVKADGLALGKGVVIAQSREEAAQAVRDMMSGALFGQSGRTVIIEEFLQGPELTVLAFADGRTVRPMVSSRDHKRALDRDQGLNTGGMGAVAPGADLTDRDWQIMHDTIFQLTIDAMAAEGRPFRGVIYFGLMLTAQGPKVIEYNARFGDPEAQVVLPLLKTDLMDIVDAILAGQLAELAIDWRTECACCVVMASGGYPAAYQTGYPIEGLAATDADCLVFHAGTRLENGQVVTAGGRVLGVTCLAATMPEAIDKCYKNVARISFQNMHYRHDIGTSLRRPDEPK